ncbi:MAG TPA: hypothetical protein VLC53_20340 [Myxococcota bacterium]|nr:hypothetical protein [Myxococcota bacterium]
MVERETIFRELWGGQWYGSPKAIDVHAPLTRRGSREAARMRREK